MHTKALGFDGLLIWFINGWPQDDPDNPDKSKHLYGKTYTLDAMTQVQIDIDKLPQLEGKPIQECW